VSLIETHLSRLLVGREIDPYAIDEILCREGGPLLENIGSNTALSISIATVRAYAAARKKDLFEAVGELAGVAHFFIPQSMYNIVNGGVHAHNNLAIQEFLVRPQKSPSFAKSFQEITTLYHCLEKLLQSAGYVTPLGDEGGFSPSAKEGALSLTEEIVFEFIISAREKCGMLESVELAIDAAANTFYDKANKCYMFKSEHLTNAELVDRYMLWRTKYCLASI
jgi:enolase